MEFIIEKNIPVSNLRSSSRGVSSKLEITLKNMEIGDSFIFPITEDRTTKSIRSMVSFVSKRVGVKTSTTVIENGVRVWRTA